MADTANPTVMPRAVLDRELTRSELRGCAMCGFENWDPATEKLNGLDLCPSCAGHYGYVEVRVCRTCGELYPADDECPCYGAVQVKFA
jgi:hypothetical protein